MASDEFSIQEHLHSHPYVSGANDISEFLNWLVEAVQPYINGNILEVGSGNGNISSLILDQGFSMHLADCSKNNRDLLRSKFANRAAVKGVYSIDLNRPGFLDYYKEVFNTFNTILALNVNETGLYKHIAVNNASHLLYRHGRLVLTVPVVTTLYSGIIGHQEELKRYNHNSLKRLCSDIYEIEKVRYYNLRDNYTHVSQGQIGLSALVVLRKFE